MKYELIMCDVPWRYSFSKSKSRKVENQYPTLTIEELKNIPIEQYMAKDCVLFFWATMPKLQQAFEVLEAWNQRIKAVGGRKDGLSYKTGFAWDKKKIGMGFFVRGRHELLLIATRGKPGHPAPSDRPASIIDEKRTEHSRKPVQAYEYIERMYPNKTKLELFARVKRAGWDSTGLELDGVDLRT